MAESPFSSPRRDTIEVPSLEGGPGATTWVPLDPAQSLRCLWCFTVRLPGELGSTRVAVYYPGSNSQHQPWHLMDAERVLVSFSDRTALEVGLNLLALSPASEAQWMWMDAKRFVHLIHRTGFDRPTQP